MNSNTTIHISQALSQLLCQDGRLSHKQQLESEERCKQRVNSLKVKAQSVKNAPHSADEQVKWAYDLVVNVLTPSQQEMAGYIHLMENQFEEVTASYPTIGANIKRSEKTIDRGIQHMRELRLAFTMPRFVKRNGKMVRTSNRTWLHPIFRHPKLREMLKNVSVFFGHVFKQTPRFLSLWLLFSASRSSLQVENVPGEYIDIYRSNKNVESDTTSREERDTHSRELNITSPKVSNIQSREVDISFNEGSHLLPARKGDMTSRELIQEDNHSRSGYAFEELPRVNATPDREVSMDKQELSQKIAEMRKSLEPQRAAQRALKAKSASEISELLQGRVTATLHLSAKGQFYLLRYSDGALLYGLENLAHHGTVDNQLNFRLFESACIEYSRRNEIEVEADHYDNLLKQLGYMESQPLCKKILLESPLAQKRVAAPEPQKVEPAANGAQGRTIYQPRRRVVKPPEHSGQVAVDDFLKDSFSALAAKLGYSQMVPNSPQISTKDVDNG
jgi:hypothetical protein